MYYVSVMGGAPVFIRSNGGFDEMVSMNSVVLESKAVPNAKFLMPPISGNPFFIFIL
jgi:hypothetical protein